MTEKWQRWTKEELSILSQHYSNATREELMQLFPGRTWRAIGNAGPKNGLHRPHYGVPRSEEFLDLLHTKLSLARINRISGYAPFAGCSHSEETKQCISVSNLFVRGHSISDIAKRNGIEEEEVKRMLQQHGGGKTNG